jgi:AcrR family transcriptional regulator
MPRAGLTKDAVIDAATSLADTEGLSAVTLARLSEELGVKPPSLYKHVDGLGDVQKALALRGLQEAHRRLQRAAVGRAKDEALFALAHAYWRFARERPGLYAASLRAARPDEPDVADAATALIEIVLAVLAGFGVEGDDALHATRGFRAIIHGFVGLDAAGGFQLGLDLEESFARLIGAFARHLAERSRIGSEENRFE